MCQCPACIWDPGATGQPWSAGVVPSTFVHEFLLVEKCAS